MAIRLAKERNGIVYVYDENGHQKTSTNGTLVGYTSDTYSVERCGVTYVYDINGHMKYSR